MRARHLVTFVALALAAGGPFAQTGISRSAASPAGAVPATPAPVQAAPAPVLPASAPSQQPASMMPAPIGSGGGAAPMPGGPLPGAAAPKPLDLTKEALDRTAPLTADEILQLRKELVKRSQAAQQPLVPVAKPTRRVVRLDLSPGASPEVVRTAFAQGTVVSFVDAAGRPWPVLTADNYNPEGFDQALFGTSAVSIGVKKEGSRAGSVAVLLEGLNTPITFSMVTGQQEVDYTVEMQLPRYLPGAPAPVGAVEQMKSLGAADLMNYLLNTPPREARQLVSDSPNVTAWQISAERMIVRTDALVAAPAWQRRQSSTSGVNVYDLPITPALVVSAQSQLMTVRLSGFIGTKEQR
ncbi:DotH/IcmK family type IV secretion protein [Ramlibacter sp. AN1133]|uniref:DotH/IcmK family type IV secretion protein n=1 Tax=Ramlibacter sp. AN1133 TaxID=3133429 RepID=UPI0030BC7CD1